jgi:hypothetical protein
MIIADGMNGVTVIKGIMVDKSGWMAVLSV